MRYKNKKKKKGKVFGKEYVLPKMPNDDAILEEERHDPDYADDAEIDDYAEIDDAADPLAQEDGSDADYEHYEETGEPQDYADYAEIDAAAAAQNYAEYDEYDERAEHAEYDEYAEHDEYAGQEFEQQEGVNENPELDGAEQGMEGSADAVNDGDADDESETGRQGLVHRRSKKVRKKKNYALRILLCLLGIAAVYLILTSKLFEIREIEVTNNNHYSAEQVIEMSGVETETNMFKTRMGRIEKKLEKDSYIENANIKRKPFHKVEIVLEEREENYCILSDNKYIIANYEGIVLSIVDEPPPLTVIRDIKVREAEIGGQLKTDSSLVFSEVISFLQTASENDMFFMEIVASDVIVKAYLNDIFLCKGTIKDMEKDIAQIKRVIHDLKEKQIARGTIIVTGNGSCTFNPEI